MRPTIYELELVMSTRSAAIIRPALYWALPTREVTTESGSQLHEDGTCRFCGHNESEDLGFAVTECPYLACQDAYASTAWARCSCCDEVVPVDVPCRVSLAVWAQTTVQVA